MKNLFTLLLFALTGCQFFEKKQSSTFHDQPSYFEPAAQKPIALIGANVIPMKTDGIIFNQIVFVENGRIKKLVANTSENLQKIPSKYRRIDTKEKYLIPGLIDAHVHIGFFGDVQDAYLETALFIVNGVTAVRNMAGMPLTLQIRKQVQTRKIIGPRVVTTGPIYNGAQAYKGANRADWCFRDSKPEKCAILSESFARQRVIEDKRLGYDAIKSREALSREVYLSLYKESKKQGMDLVGHYPSVIGYKEFFVNKYQSSVEHVNHFGQFVRKDKFPFEEKKEEERTYDSLGLGHLFKDSKKEKDLLSAFSKSGVYFVPTLSLKKRLVQNIKEGGYLTQEPIPFYSKCKFEILSKVKSFYKNMQKWLNFKGKNYVDLGHKANQSFVYEAWKAEVPLVVGSDPGGLIIPGFSTYDELKALSEAGIPNQEVLKSATVRAAQMLKLKDTGFIDSGAVADMVLLDKNPLKDISATRKISGVFVRGQYFDRKKIKNSLEKIKEVYKNRKCN